MKNLVYLVICLITSSAVAQEDTISLDVLSAPQSPAANLMGFTDSDILKPETPTDFMANIKTASNGFSQVPNSLAMDVRLKSMIFPNRNSSFSDYIRISKTQQNPESPVWNNIAQTTIVSFGYQNYDGLEDSLKTGQGIGIGFKFSILRGSKYEDNFATYYNKLDSAQSEMGKYGAEAYKKFQDSDAYKRLKDQMRSASGAQKQVYADSIELLTSQFVTDYNNLQKGVDELSGYVEKMGELKTYGLVWDFAGGMVLDFPTNNFDYSLAGKAGVWTTFGYEAKNGLNFLGLGRMLYNPNLQYQNNLGALDTANIANYDLGARLLYEHPGKSFSLSAEGIYRGVVNNYSASTYRFTFNVGYEVYKNMKLTFMFGRDFDGTTTRDGNVISALQLLAGFGSKKKVGSR